MVNPSFKAGKDGIDMFNAVAAKCFDGDPTCPALSAEGKGLLGIVLDDEVLSAPSINVASFDRDEIQISGSFDKDSAESLAVALRFGSLPIELAPQQAENVSATLGEGALQAGIISGPDRPAARRRSTWRSTTGSWRWWRVGGLCVAASAL